jgi:hypothetical protein
MTPLVVHEPIDIILLAFGAPTTRSSEDVGGWGIDCQGEEVRGLGEVGDEAAVEDEVEQDADVHEKDEEEHDEPAARIGVFDAA